MNNTKPHASSSEAPNNITPSNQAASNGQIDLKDKESSTTLKSTESDDVSRNPDNKDSASDTTGFSNKNKKDATKKSSAPVNEQLSSASATSNTALLSMGGGLRIFWSIAVLVYALLSPVHSTFRFITSLLILAAALLSGPFFPFVLTFLLISVRPPRTSRLLLLLSPDRKLHVPSAQKSVFTSNTGCSHNFKRWLKLEPTLFFTAFPCLLLATALPVALWYFFPQNITAQGSRDLITASAGIIIFLVCVSSVLINATFTNAQKTTLLHPARELPASRQDKNNAIEGNTQDAIKPNKPDKPFLTALKVLGPEIVQLLFFSGACALSIPMVTEAARTAWAACDRLMMNRYDILTGLSGILPLHILDYGVIILCCGAIIYAMSAVIHRISDLN